MIRADEFFKAWGCDRVLMIVTQDLITGDEEKYIASVDKSDIEDYYGEDLDYIEEEDIDAYFQFIAWEVIYKAEHGKAFFQRGIGKVYELTGTEFCLLTEFTL